jgi:phosphatidylglycerophosphate synthase
MAEGHTRENSGILAESERRVLVAIAGRLPDAVSSDHLTALGLGAMAVTGACFAAAGAHPAWLLGVVAALALNWFGDSLDGTVARVRGRQRPQYGYYVDHVIDILGAALLLAGLSLSPFMHPLVAVSLLAAYSMVCAETYLATHTVGVFRMAFLRVGPTELRILLAIGALALLRDPHVAIGGTQYRLFDVGGVIATMGLGIALCAAIVRNTRALYVAEPLPARPVRASSLATGARDEVMSR